MYNYLKPLKAKFNFCTFNIFKYRDKKCIGDAIQLTIKFNNY